MCQVLLPALRGAPASRQQEKTARWQRERLTEIVARARSPYCRELYQGLPERVEDPALLPVTHKRKLMARFDNWVIDRDVTLDKVRSFIGHPDLIARTSSQPISLGTTGTPAFLVLDYRQISAGKTGSQASIPPVASVLGSGQAGDADGGVPRHRRALRSRRRHRWRC